MIRREKIKILIVWLFFTAMLIFAMWHFTGCSNINIVPKSPYPYSYHQENKTCEYWLYHKHWQTKGDEKEVKK